MAFSWCFSLSHQPVRGDSSPYAATRTRVRARMAHDASAWTFKRTRWTVDVGLPVVRGHLGMYGVQIIQKSIHLLFHAEKSTHLLALSARRALFLWAHAISALAHATTVWYALRRAFSVVCTQSMFVVCWCWRDNQRRCQLCKERTTIE